MNSEKTICILGGGILGMTLAYKLSRQGRNVTLFEAAPTLGGLAAPWKLGNIEWDRFYHVILKSDLFLRQLLVELGLEEKINWKETRTGFYTDGSFFSMSNTLEFLKFPPINFIDKLRLGYTIFYASKIKDAEKLERFYAGDWLTRLSGKKVFSKIWLPLLKSKLGENYEQTSAAFIWATIQRMYSARRSGLKKEMFGYIPGGYSVILNKFSEKLKSENVKIKTNYSASKIKKSNDCFTVEFTNGEKEYFNQVIITLPSPIAGKICEDIPEEERRKLNNVQYLGVVCASLLIKKPLSGFYVTNITEPGINFTGIIDMGALVDKEEFNGQSLVYLPKYLNSEDPFFSCSDEEIKEKFFTSLKKIYPEISLEDIIEFKIARAKNVFALSSINYSKNLPPVVSTVPGLFILNSAHIVNGTLNVNETIQLAEKNFDLINDSVV